MILHVKGILNNGSKLKKKLFHLLVVHKFTSEFTEAVKELRLADPVEPTNPDPTNPIAFALWKLEIREYRMKAQEFNNFVLTYTALC
jgi:hypothetical protein